MLQYISQVVIVLKKNSLIIRRENAAYMPLFVNAEMWSETYIDYRHSTPGNFVNFVKIEPHLTAGKKIVEYINALLSQKLLNSPTEGDMM